MAHYIHDEKNNRIEGMSKEEIYALLAEAIQEGELPSVDEDTAFVTMFKSIVDGNAYKMGFCTQAQYNQLVAAGEVETDALYIITDDATLEDLTLVLLNLNNTVNDLNNQINTKQDKINVVTGDFYFDTYNELYDFCLNLMTNTKIIGLVVWRAAINNDAHNKTGNIDLYQTPTGGSPYIEIIDQTFYTGSSFNSNKEKLHNIFYRYILLD